MVMNAAVAIALARTFFTFLSLFLGWIEAPRYCHIEEAVKLLLCQFLIDEQVPEYILIDVLYSDNQSLNVSATECLVSPLNDLVLVENLTLLARLLQASVTLAVDFKDVVERYHMRPTSVSLSSLKIGF